MPPPSSTDPLRPGHNASGSGSHSTNVNLSDVAGVLRRNQACLNCRRRKLVRLSFDPLDVLLIIRNAMLFDRIVEHVYAHIDII